MLNERAFTAIGEHHEQLGQLGVGATLSDESLEGVAPAPAAPLADDGERRASNVGQNSRAIAGHTGLGPSPVRPAKRRGRMDFREDRASNVVEPASQVIGIYSSGENVPPLAANSSTARNRAAARAVCRSCTGVSEVIRISPAVAGYVLFSAAPGPVNMPQGARTDLPSIEGRFISQEHRRPGP